MSEIEEMLRKIKMPPRDLYDLPTSTKTFPDGCHFRIEHCASSNKEAFETLVAESEKRGVPLHRLIVAVRRLDNWMSDQELAEFARMGKENRIELVIWAGLDKPQSKDLRLNGMDQVANAIKATKSYIDMGFRSFYVTDEGLLWALSELRKVGEIPKNVRFKVSSAMGYGNPCSAKVTEMLGADSFNPVAEVSLPTISSIRNVINIPLDLYIQSSPEQTRIAETPDIARIAAPVNFKFEPDLPPFKGYMYDLIGGPNSITFAKKKAQWSQFVKELVEKYYPEAKLSKQGPNDLAIPV